ncbi:hypothetical protein ACHAXA_004017 [Cyclostephanos tholiformis]|uniref:Uncharacterized protein n=1 Tax=Cyclostephanos tholiformis TaxID=382380 RepID=A0ABD3S0B0_9STRA
MWHHQTIPQQGIEEEGVGMFVENYGCNNSIHHLQHNRHAPQHLLLRHSSVGGQNSSGITGRSHSLGMMNLKHHQSNMQDHRHHHFLNEIFTLHESALPRNNCGGVGTGDHVDNNPLGRFSALLARTAAKPRSAPLHPLGASALASSLTTATATLAASGAASLSSSSRAARVSPADAVMMMRTGAGCGGSPSPADAARISPFIPSASASAMMTTATTTTSGPTELYRLIASPPPPGGDSANYWNVVLNRAIDHPHEACFYDPNAGGHVYALHRLLRRTTWEEDEEGEYGDADADDHEDDDVRPFRRRRPPVSVVEAVMRACPRAVTRKQAVANEDTLLLQSSSSSPTMGVDDRNVRRMSTSSPPLLPVAAAAAGEEDGGGEGRGPHEEDVADADDVRFEYPLAIACECRQDGEVVRLLASYLGTAAPAYRSEVYRSLDYASLPNHVVRILLEEHAGCVIERGTNSEATEGDDDDSPLEQVLFWWDDPDMMGMEEEILAYPNCDMREDLCNLWEKLHMMLYAATTGTMTGYDDSKDSFQVLHHVLRIVSVGGIGGVHFPNDFAHAVLLIAKYIQRERRSMFEERDETGSLPLHIAVSGDSLLRQNDHPSQKDDERAVGGRGDLGQYENDDQMNHAIDEVVGAEYGDLAMGGEAPQPDDGPLHLLPAEQLLAGGEQAEVDDDDDDDDDDSEADDNAEEGDNEDTSAMPSDMELVRVLLDQHPASIRLRDSQSGSLPIHLILRYNPRAVDVIELFLDLYPRSVTMPDGNGRLPIHLAIIQNSPTWGKLLAMSPIALEARDPVTSLLPFQLAAMSKPTLKDDMEGPTITDEKDQYDELESLSTCYQLLRMSPCLASGLAEIKPRFEQQILVRYKPRVTKLEEENERLRKRVEELEIILASMQMSETGVHAIPPGCPHRKKRKSQSALS